MTMASRGVHSIQEKARGDDMKAKNVSMKKTKVSVKKPLDSMSVGAAMAPMDQAAGLRSGMKKGGSCGTKMAKGGACKGYFKGGSVDGVIKKGRTKGKMC